MNKIVYHPIFYLLSILILIFPIFRLFDVRIPIFMCLFMPSLLLLRKISIHKRKNFVIFFQISLIYLFFVTILTYFNNVNFALKDVLYLAYPICQCVTFIIFLYIFRVPKYRQSYLRLIKTFLLLNLITCVLDSLGIGLPEFLNIVREYLHGMHYTDAFDISSASYNVRSAGLVGNSAMLGNAVILSMLILLTTETKINVVWHVIGFAIILMAGARTALILYAILFSYSHGSNLGIRSFAAMMLVFVIIVILVTVIEEDNLILVTIKNVLQGNIQNDFSVIHRLRQLSLFFDNLNYLLVGGMVVADFEIYVDSAFIMRSLQFGLVGYLCMNFLLIYAIVSKLVFSKFISFCVVLMECTSFISTNWYFIVLLTSLLAMSAVVTSEKSSKC